MRSLPVGNPKVKAFYAHLFDRSGVLTKLDGTIYFLGDDDSLIEYEPDMANFCTVLGECAVSDTQQVWTPSSTMAMRQWPVAAARRCGR
jgi:hypothetical protein